MGRKKPDSFRKTERVEIRLNKSEADALKKLAEQRNQSMSNIVRNLIIKEYMKLS